MPTHYVFIDYENVQPSDLAVLADPRFRVLVFAGANQTKFASKINALFQKTGSEGKCVQITGQGNNALDFHIAFYIGCLVTQDSTACVHIIAKDTGYDPLIRHLNQRGIHAQRHAALTDIPLLTSQKGAPDHFTKVMENLKRLGTSRPRTQKKLTNTIAMFLQQKRESAEVAAVVERLKSAKYLVINGTTVVYTQAT